MKRLKEILSSNFEVCSALIDQNRYIKDGYTGYLVPVGYSCHRFASEVFEGKKVCRQCLEIAKNERKRVSFYGFYADR